jgi:hypothetical protein
MASNMTYKILYKIDEPDASRWGIAAHSDEIGCIYNSSDDAIVDIAAIKDNPARAGYVDWMGFATMWVVDCRGNIIWS